MAHLFYQTAATFTLYSSWHSDQKQIATQISFFQIFGSALLFYSTRF